VVALGSCPSYHLLPLLSYSAPFAIYHQYLKANHHSLQLTQNHASSYKLLSHGISAESFPSGMVLLLRRTLSCRLPEIISLRVKLTLYWFHHYFCLLLFVKFDFAATYLLFPGIYMQPRNYSFFIARAQVICFRNCTSSNVWLVGKDQRMNKKKLVVWFLPIHYSIKAQ
jgi:hypothetical protein